MKTEIKTQSGFTLIELLVVTILIGILSAIALPNFVWIFCRGRQAEAKSFIGNVNLELVGQGETTLEEVGRVTRNPFKHQ